MIRDFAKVMRNLEILGERYCIVHLNQWNKKKLQNNWWKSLKFFFDHSFLRGRSDKLSKEYYSFTIKTLKDYFAVTNETLDDSFERLKINQKYFNKDIILKFKKDRNIRNSIKHPDFKAEVGKINQLIDQLITKKQVEIKLDHSNDKYTKELSLDNDVDLMMVLDVLQFISSDDKKNVYNYILNRIITDSSLKPIFDELCNIRAIGDKITSLIIRDILLLNPDVIQKTFDFELAFPVDTWVIKISHKLGFMNTDINEIKNYFICNCNKTNTDILKVGAGIWYLGFHSLDILVEDFLGEVDFIDNQLTNNN